MKVSRILIPTRPQSDSIVAVFLAKELGRSVFDGIEDARVEIAIDPPAQPLEAFLAQGVLPLDMGGTELDHHGKNPPTTCSELMAEKLGIKDDPALSKLIQFVRRCDMLGKGIISTDPIDKAFGLPGLIMALNKLHAQEPDKVVSAFLPILRGHYYEEVQRTRELPKEFEEAVNQKKVDTFTVRQRDKNLKVVMIETDNLSMAGYLKSQIGGRFDVVVRRGGTGHINILTRPTKRVDLRSLALVLRLEEANQQGTPLDKDARYLSKPERISEVPQWYYDTATNSILNGGMNTKDVEPSRIDQFTLKKLVEAGLSEKIWSPISQR